MSFDLSNLVTEEKKFGPSKYLTFGVQDLKINKMEIKVASTKSKQIIFFMEGPKNTDPLFEGVDGAQGAIGRVTTMYYKEESEKDGVMILGKIADALGVREKFNTIKHNDFTELVNGASTVLAGKFAGYAIGSEQYWDEKAGKAKNSLRFTGKFDFVEKQGTTPSKLTFDKTNKYHFKSAIIPDTIGTEASGTAVKSDGLGDLPF